MTEAHCHVRCATSNAVTCLEPSVKTAYPYIQSLTRNQNGLVLPTWDCTS